MFGKTLKGVVKAAQKSDKSKHHFEVTLRNCADLDNVDESSVVLVQIARGAKVVQSSKVRVVAPTDRLSGGINLLKKSLQPGSTGLLQATFDEACSLVCTLYASKKADTAFSEKAYKVSLLLAQDRRPPKELASAELNLAAFATMDPAGKKTDHTLHLMPRGLSKKGGKAAAGGYAGPQLGLEVHALFLKDVKVDDDEESLSSQQIGGGFSATPSSAGGERSEQDLGGFDEALVDEALRAVEGGSPGGSHARRDGSPAQQQSESELRLLREKEKALAASLETRKAAGSGGAAAARSTPDSAEAARLQAEVEALQSELRASQERQAALQTRWEAAAADARRDAEQAWAEARRAQGTIQEKEEALRTALSAADTAVAGAVAEAAKTAVTEARRSSAAGMGEAEAVAAAARADAESQQQRAAAAEAEAAAAREAKEAAAAAAAEAEAARAAAAAARAPTWARATRRSARPRG